MYNIPIETEAADMKKNIRLTKRLARRYERRLTRPVRRTATLLTVTIVGSALMNTFAAVADVFIKEGKKRK